MKTIFKRRPRAAVVDFEMTNDQLHDLERRINAAREAAPAGLHFANRIQFILYLHEMRVFKTREEMLYCTALMYS